MVQHKTLKIDRVLTAVYLITMIKQKKCWKPN